MHCPRCRFGLTRLSGSELPSPHRPERVCQSKWSQNEVGKIALRLHWTNTASYVLTDFTKKHLFNQIWTVWIIIYVFVQKKMIITDILHLCMRISLTWDAYLGNYLPISSVWLTLLSSPVVALMQPSPTETQQHSGAGQTSEPSEESPSSASLSAKSACLPLEVQVCERGKRHKYLHGNTCRATYTLTQARMHILQRLKVDGVIDKLVSCNIIICQCLKMMEKTAINAGTVEYIQGWSGRQIHQNVVT